MRRRLDLLAALNEGFSTDSASDLTILGLNLAVPKSHEERAPMQPAASLEPMRF